MPKPYSDELRRKILEAYDSGCGSLRALAHTFSVSYDYARKISAQRLRNGQIERVPARPRPARVGRIAEQALLERLNELEHRSILELRQDLETFHGLSISPSYLWQIKKRLVIQEDLSA